MNTPNKTAPDYGEPWHKQEPPHPISVRAGVYWLNPRQFNRAVACVNACAGMTDPAAEIQALREAVKEAYEALETSSRSLHGNSYYKTQTALSKLKTLI